MRSCSHPSERLCPTAARIAVSQKFIQQECKQERHCRSRALNPALVVCDAAQHQAAALQAPEVPQDKLLAFFWTASEHAQFVLVTSGGLQLLELGAQGLKSTKASREMQATANEGLADILWCKYQHHCRLLLLGTQFELFALQITAQVCASPARPLVCHQTHCKSIKQCGTPPVAARRAMSHPWGFSNRRGIVRVACDVNSHTLQRGITKLRSYNLSRLFGNIAASTASSLQAALTAVRAEQSVAQPAGVRMYVCVVDALGLAIHVLALSSAEITHVGTLEWPTLSAHSLSAFAVKCAGPMHPFEYR